ncbi:hypothetical protein [Azoarcus sp. DN11]|uniref:hypothetical protein n=1 Tax=Azoarcus sp. DN11 TaxID=356837 RepID=UPI0025704CDB|nr:hypothetical protein [Azoarcus sp. DN11]
MTSPMTASAPSAAEPAPADLLHHAQARFRTLDSYRATLRTLAADGLRQVIAYAYRKPGWVRLEFIEPHHGAILIYDPATRRAHLRPFGKGHFPTFDLAPDNPLIRSPAGHRIDRSDVGTLIAKLVELRAQGTMTDPVDATVSERPARHVEITGPPGADADGVRRYPRLVRAGHPVPDQGPEFRCHAQAHRNRRHERCRTRPCLS